MNIQARLAKAFRPNDPSGDMNRREFMFFGIAGFGQNMIVTFLASFIMIFFTDVLLIGAATVAFIMLGIRLFDAVSDPVFATIFDKTRTRWGKLRPYLLFSPIPIVILTVLSFTYWGSGISHASTIIIASLTYALWSVAYTFKDVPYWALSASITTDAKKRTNLLTFARLTSAAGAGLIQLLVPIITGITTDGIRFEYGNRDPLAGPIGSMARIEMSYEAQGLYNAFFENPDWLRYNGEMAARIQPVLANAFFWTVFIAMIPALIMMFTVFWTNERVFNETKPQSLRHNMGMLFKNKPVLLIVLVGIFGSLRTLNIVMLIYFATYNLQNVGFAAFPGIFLIVPGGLIASLLTPYCSRRFGKRNTWIWSHLAGGVVGVAMWFIALPGHNWIAAGGLHTWQMVFFIGGTVLLGFPMGFSNILTYAMIGDTVDYLDLKTGERAEGICFATQTFISKIGFAMTAFIGLSILGISDFLPNQIQEMAVLNNIWLTMTLLTGISTALCVVPLFWYKLNDEHQKMAIDLVEKRNKMRKETGFFDEEQGGGGNFEEDFRIDIIKREVIYPKSMGGGTKILTVEELKNFTFERSVQNEQA